MCENNSLLELNAPQLTYIDDDNNGFLWNNKCLEKVNLPNNLNKTTLEKLSKHIKKLIEKKENNYEKSKSNKSR